jgi:2-C-methyl-D-erythritol 4-phosphate cytidylyltransferase
MKATNISLVAIVPAAGVGARMQANCPKQYLTIDKLTILEHTVNRLLAYPSITKVIVALGEQDSYFSSTSLAKHDQVQTVLGGQQRVDSVLAGLKVINPQEFPWVLVHDAARPCVTHQDIGALIQACTEKNIGGLLASPVRDTMKRSTADLQVSETVDRENLWHALTPQMYPVTMLMAAIEQALIENVMITDESSAMELAKKPSLVVSSSSENIKITRPEDLAMAAFILAKQQESR